MRRQAAEQQSLLLRGLKVLSQAGFAQRQSVSSTATAVHTSAAAVIAVLVIIALNMEEEYPTFLSNCVFGRIWRYH